MLERVSLLIENLGLDRDLDLGVGLQKGDIQKDQDLDRGTEEDTDLLHLSEEDIGLRLVHAETENFICQLGRLCRKN